MSALSNMPRVKTGERRRRSEDSDDQDSLLLWDTFKTTPTMSTYLVALVVSKYAVREVRADGGQVSKQTAWSILDINPFSVYRSSASGAK